MTPISKQKFHKFGEFYEISVEGFIRLTSENGKAIAGRMLMPTMRTGKVHYVLRDKKTGTSSRHILTNILFRELSINAVELGQAGFPEIREMCLAHNARLSAAQGKKEKRAARRDFTPSYSTMDDPFPGMATGITGLGSWDCPEMDPFGAGHYQVRLDMGEAAQIERRAA